MVKWQKLAGASSSYRSIAMIIIFVENEKCRSGSGMTVLLFMGNCNSLNSHVIPTSAQLQCIHNVTITVSLSLAEISPEFAVLSNELVKMLGVKDKKLLLRDTPCPSVLLSLFRIARTSLSIRLC